MARLYLTLAGILLLTYGLFVAGVLWLPDRALHGTMQRYYERAMIGAFDLVEDRLARHPSADWGQVIAELAPHFRDGLALHALDGLAVADAERAALRAGKLVFRGDGEQTRFYKRVPGSDRTLEMVLGRTEEQMELDEVAGIVYLIETRFLGAAKADWPDVLADLDQAFGMPLALLDIDDPALPPERLADLRAGRAVVLGLEAQQATYYKRLGDSHWVFRAGPLRTPLILRYFNPAVLALLALLIAAAAYAWVRPIWGDLKRLDRGVRRLGAGELETRLEVRKESALAPLADTFNGMAGRIQGLIRSHRELTNAVSHELRTPIARLRFRIDLLEAPGSETDRRRHLEQMRRDVGELELLVAESLSYARLDRERPDLQREVVDLGDWLAATLAEMEVELAGVEVHLVAPDAAVCQAVSLDSRQMGRAVQNLLRNARRHAQSRVRVSGYARDGLARILVEDDGCGVPESERERVFAPFARLDSARARELGGVGLGLAIVRQIARWHDGQARVERSDLGGAQFIVEWPSAPD